MQQKEKVLSRHSKAPLEKQSKRKWEEEVDLEKVIRKERRRLNEKRDASFPENELHREVAPISLQGLKMISNLIPNEATHSSLDLFEKPPFLVTFENAFTQKIGPSYSPDGPMLEFEVLGDRNNFIDLQRTRLEMVARIVRSNGTCFERMLQRRQTEIRRIL